MARPAALSCTEVSKLSWAQAVTLEQRHPLPRGTLSAAGVTSDQRPLTGHLSKLSDTVSTWSS